MNREPSLQNDHYIAENINSASSVSSGILLGTIGVLSFIVQPGLIQGFVSELGVSDAMANQLAFNEMLGVAIATYVTSFLESRLNWRCILFSGLLCLAVGNAWSALSIINLDLFPYARGLSGFGAGVTISLSFTIIGLTERTERNLAWYLVCLLTYGAIGLWVMPQTISLIGLKGIFVAWAIITFLSLITVKLIPQGADNQSREKQTVNLNSDFKTYSPEVKRSLKIMALAGVLLFNTAIGITWANVFLIGLTIVDSAQSIANALLLSQFVAVFGALIPVFLERKLGINRPIVLTISGCICAIVILLLEADYLWFIISVCLFNFFWNFGLPFILSAVGEFDKEGKMISLAIAMQMTGLGFGPFLAAILLGNSSDFFDIMLLVILLLVSSIPLLFKAMHDFKQRQQPKAI